MNCRFRRYIYRRANALNLGRSVQVIKQRRHSAETFCAEELFVMQFARILVKRCVTFWGYFSEFVVNRHAAKLRMKVNEKYMSKGNSQSDVSQASRLIFRLFNCINVIVQIWRLYVSLYQEGVWVYWTEVFQLLSCLTF